MIVVVVTILITLLMSGFFSGMEIAFLSKNRLKLEIDRKQSRLFDRIASIFANNAGQYITTILVGNNIALVVYSLAMSHLIEIIFANFGWEAFKGSIIIETTISTIVIIFVAEFMPKSIFRSNPNFYYRIFAPAIYLFYILLYPIARFTTMLSHAMLRLLGHNISDAVTAKGFDRHDLASLIESGAAESTSESDNEIKLFQNALDFADLRVRDAMSQRVDIEAVDIDSATIEELTDRFAQTKYSRLFVWQGSIDNIIGYVNSKSLFDSPKRITEVLKEVSYVPESMPLNSLMQELIKHKSNICVVIDEFGGTAGVISLEDALEQIFGEIEDEYDEPEMIEKEVGEGEYVLSSRLEIPYLNERYNLELEQSDDYDTLAGYIIYHHVGIPSAGERLFIDHFEIKILQTTRSRIELVKLKIIKKK
ncbi:MAG: hemolysin family protein [Rikenellaceae bacterium]